MNRPRGADGHARGMFGSWPARTALGPRPLSMNRRLVAADVRRRIPSCPPPHVGGYGSWTQNRSERNRPLPTNRACKAGVNPRTPYAARLRKRVRSARSVWSPSGLLAISGSWPRSKSNRNTSFPLNQARKAAVHPGKRKETGRRSGLCCSAWGDRAVIAPGGRTTPVRPPQAPCTGWPGCRRRRSTPSDRPTAAACQPPSRRS